MCALTLASAQAEYSELWWKSIHIEHMFMSKFDSAFKKELEDKHEVEWESHCESEVRSLAFEFVSRLCGESVSAHDSENVTDLLVESTNHLDKDKIFLVPGKQQFVDCMIARSRELINRELISSLSACSDV